MPGSGRSRSSPSPGRSSKPPDPDWCSGTEEAVTRSTQPSAFYSGHNGVHRVLKTYLLGLLDTRLGDTDRATVRAAELDSAGRTADGPPLALELAQGLQARIALANGRSDSALADLEALRIEGGTS